MSDLDEKKIPNLDLSDSDTKIKSENDQREIETSKIVEATSNDVGGLPTPVELKEELSTDNKEKELEQNGKGVQKKIKAFKDEEFETIIKSEDISVIQFSAEWCAPCKVLVPLMEKLSDNYKDKANFYYADIENDGINTASAAGVRGVPTVIVYKKGVEVDRKVGGVAESQMKEFLDKNI